MHRLPIGFFFWVYGAGVQFILARFDFIFSVHFFLGVRSRCPVYTGSLLCPVCAGFGMHHSGKWSEVPRTLYFAAPKWWHLRELHFAAAKCNSRKRNCTSELPSGYRLSARPLWTLRTLEWCWQLSDGPLCTPQVAITTSGVPSAIAP